MTRPSRDGRIGAPVLREFGMRGYQSSPDGGTTWDDCTRTDVEGSLGSPVYRALRDERVRDVTSIRGVVYRKRPTRT